MTNHQLPFRIFVGYDKSEVVAYHVLCQSIIDQCSSPVRFTPINLDNIGSIFKRERNSLQSTEFSFSRFLVPFLSGYSGWSLFMDCDMFARVDFSEILSLRDENKAVMVCKHDYVPKEDVKFLGQTQTKYLFGTKRFNYIPGIENCDTYLITANLISVNFDGFSLFNIAS